MLSQHPSNQAVYNEEEDNDKQTEVTHQTTILCPCSVHLFHLCKTVAKESSCILEYSTLEIEITSTNIYYVRPVTQMGHQLIDKANI